MYKDKDKEYYTVAELSDSEQQLIKETLADDHRYIGNKSNEDNGLLSNEFNEDNGQLFNEFNENDGMFYQFKRMVEAYLGELVVAFRGNSNKITVYYNNHVVWDLAIAGEDCYTASFNYNHARYYCGKGGEDTGEDCLEPLRNLLYVDEKKREKWFYREKEEEFKKTDKQAAIGILKWEREKGHPFEYDLIEKSYFIIKDILDSYFNIRCSIDRFRRKAEIAPPKRAKQSYIEKRWQQALFNYFKYTEGEEITDLFAYDLEFSQPFPNKKIREKIGVNEPDILAVRFENGVPKHLVFVEVKSTKSACEDKSSGVRGHIIGMKRYTDEECFLRKRVDDVWRILEQYQLTGLYRQLEGINFNELKKSIRLEESVERVLLFTNNELPPGEMTEDEREKGSALDYYYAHEEKIWNLAKENDCKIWVTEGDYFADIIKVVPLSFSGNES